MNVYLDSSVILRRLWEEPGGLDDWGSWDETWTSELTRVELLRSVDRLRRHNRLDDVEMAKAIQFIGETIDRAQIIELNSAVLERASRSFPVIVRTLDAIHLASIMTHRDSKKSPLVFLTHDVQLGIAAQAMGFEARGFSAP